MLENKIGEVFAPNGPDPCRPDREPSAPDHKLRRFSDLALSEAPRFVPRFQQAEYGPLFERALADLFANVEENVELSLVLSSIHKKGPRAAAPKFPDKLEANFRNSLHKNLAQRSSIKKFMGLLFSDLLALLARKDVS